MNAKDWFEFCAHEYRRGADRSEILYTRYSLLISAAIAVGAADYALLDKLSRDFSHRQIFDLVALAAGVACGLLLLFSLFHMHTSLFGSGKFRDISSTVEFQEFSNRYKEQLGQDAIGIGEDILEAWANETLREGLLTAMQEAELNNQQVVNNRLEAANYAVRNVVGAVVMVMIMAAMRIAVSFSI